jgi:hypothetical protein
MVFSHTMTSITFNDNARFAARLFNGSPGIAVTHRQM